MINNPQQPTKEFLRTIDIHTLLPQQEPFVMVGVLTEFNERFTATETTISEENIFIDNGCFSASGLIENIAQTCAARIGYANTYIFKKGIQLGFIGAIRDLRISALPNVGDVIHTRVEVLEDVFGMTLAHATITCNGNVIVESQMKIAIENAER